MGGQAVTSKRFKLCIQIPKSKVVCESGTVSVDEKGDAMFFTGNGDANDTCVAEMTRARIDFAGAAGIMLSGMQPNGCDKTGASKYIYQRWWMIYEEANA
jgi:hypothetical protein